jgi:hypothetical protein
MTTPDPIPEDLKDCVTAIQMQAQLEATQLMLARLYNELHKVQSMEGNSRFNGEFTDLYDAKVESQIQNINSIRPDVAERLKKVNFRNLVMCISSEDRSTE